MAEVGGMTDFKSVAARTNRFFQCCRVPILEITANTQVYKDPEAG